MFLRPVSTVARHHRRGGLTLLEVLLVVVILSMIAVSAVSLTDGLDQQYRFEETKRRRDDVRDAVIFDSTLHVAGQPLVSGFASDLGRLPNNLLELVQQGTLPLWQYDATAAQWAGWRGPYLPVVTEPTTGLKAFRDGWGRTDLSAANDALLFGWNFSVAQATGTLTLQSYGADGVADGAPGSGSGLYDADFPTSPSEPLIDAFDHRVNLKGWEVWVELRNPGQQPANPPNKLRLRIYYPQDNGSGGFDWPEPTIPPSDSARDQKAYLSLATLLTGGPLGSGKSTLVKFQFTSPSVNIDKYVPAGIRTIVVLNNIDGDVYNPNGKNGPVAITLVPRTTLPTSANGSPLFIWVVN